MSSEASTALLTAILDGLTLVRGQLDKVEQRQERIEAGHESVLKRLDTIDAGQTAVTDLLPTLETIHAQLIHDRALVRDQLAIIATVVAHAHGAASGNPAPLPADIVDDPLLERFAIGQPADQTSNERALAEWRAAARSAGTAELIELLRRQYQPSPTDTAETRVLRFRLAAVTRAEIKGRKVAPPPPPTTTRAGNTAVYAREARSQGLARLWRAGESTALFAEPELAGALDLFAEAERRAGPISEEQLSAELATLHGDLGDRLATGERPVLETGLAPPTADRATEIQPEKDR